jgi:hypothetical protein
VSKSDQKDHSHGVRKDRKGTDRSPIKESPNSRPILATFAISVRKIPIR